ncbi:MAG: DNA repair protein RecO [Clostridiales bacterium]|nr:DNA repair protein RecO [Clostridiales bacterium]
MIADTRGIVLRQVKTIGGRRMLSLFTEQFGKIGAGVTVSERGKGRNAAAMSPFAYGNYELYLSHGRFHLNKGQVIKNFYRIGADVDRYMAAAYGLELCDKLLEEEVAAKELFELTVDFLSTMEERKSRYGTILLAYKVKLLACLGALPVLDRCACCGTPGRHTFFSIPEGGLVCGECLAQLPQDGRDALLYKVDFVILDVLDHILRNPLGSLQKAALGEELESQINTIIDRFIKYHLDPGDLKAGSVRIEQTEV